MTEICVFLRLIVTQKTCPICPICSSLAGRTGHTPIGLSHVPVSGNILGTLESMIKIGSGFPVTLIPPFSVFSIGQPYPLFGSNGGVEI